MTSLHPLSFQSNDFSTCNNYDDADYDDDIKIRISCMGRSSLTSHTFGASALPLGSLEEPPSQSL